MILFNTKKVNTGLITIHLKTVFEISISKHLYFQELVNSYILLFENSCTVVCSKKNMRTIPVFCIFTSRILN